MFNALISALTLDLPNCNRHEINNFTIGDKREADKISVKIDFISCKCIIIQTILLSLVSILKKCTHLNCLCSHSRDNCTQLCVTQNSTVYDLLIYILNKMLLLYRIFRNHTDDGDTLHKINKINCLLFANKNGPNMAFVPLLLYCYASWCVSVRGPSIISSLQTLVYCLREMPNIFIDSLSFNQPSLEAEIDSHFALFMNWF